jgi:HPt (histidine-containing phosphotransfer) domain-containing protein
LQAALERWGPLKRRSPDTTFSRRPKALRAEDLLDGAMIEELRAMPPANGVSMLRELIDMFLEGAPARLHQISHSLNDAGNLAFHAHALKSMSLNLGAKRLVELCQKLEEFGQQGTLTGAPAVFQELQTAFDQTKTHLFPLRDF